METFHSAMQRWLGLGAEAKDLTLIQLSLRAIIVFATMYALIRIAGRRFMAQRNAWDVVLAFLVASVLARAINGTAAFWPNITLGFLIALAYRLIAWLACEFHGFGRLLKGSAVNVVVDGHVQKAALKAHHISVHDLEEDLRLNSNIGDPKAVKLARLERSGDISVEKKSG